MEVAFKLRHSSRTHGHKYMNLVFVKEGISDRIIAVGKEEVLMRCKIQQNKSAVCDPKTYDS